MAKKLKLAIIDSHALIHRAFHALPPMTTRHGAPTNAVYGFTVTLLKVLTTLKPTHLVAAFDVKGKTFRQEQFADYKAHRPKADEALVPQFELVRQVVRAFRIPLLERQGFEADDVIGTVVKELGDEIEKVIITGDMDALQLVDGTTSVFTMKRGVTDTITFNEEAVREKFGFAPSLLVDYKGLRGDPSDNIPGVAGIGDKSARELVSQWGTVEAIFAHFNELSPRLQKKLEGQKEAALMSKRLATIRTDVPLEFSLDKAVVSDFNPVEVRKVFEELEFSSLLGRIPKASTAVPAAALSRELPQHYHLAATAAEQRELKGKLTKATLIAFDTETEALGARKYPIVGMSFAFKDGREVSAWYVPVTPQLVKDWEDILANEKIKKVGHNIKYDMEVVRKSGIELKGVAFDTMIASYLLHPDSRQHNLDILAMQELQYQTIPITDLIGPPKTAKGVEQKKMSEVPLPLIAHYAAEDAEVTFKIYQKFAPLIKEQGLTRVLHEIELPLIPVLMDIELHGVKVDVQVLKKMNTKVVRNIGELKQKIWAAAGQEFNISSTKQLRDILFTKLGLPTMGIARKQSGFSTAAAELHKLRQFHPIIPLIEDYRELTKLQSTYIATLPILVNEKTGRIHTSFNQTVAATGRLSSTDPNLQNIPVRTSLGQEIRAAFVAEAGNLLIKADYSQLELRLAAHISQDEKMVAAFRAEQDIHRATAAWVHGIQPDEVTDEQRRQAKTLNFGVLYGMGPHKFAQEADISLEEARSFIGRYRQQYEGITRLVEATIDQARTQGFVETLFGRRRSMPDIHARAPGIRAQAERVAFNFPIQGTAADILKKAMIALDAVLKERFPKAHIILTVHDELVVEAPQEEVQAIAQVMKKAMEGVTTLDVPLVVDVAAGPNWRDVEPVG